MRERYAVFLLSALFVISGCLSGTDMPSLPGDMPDDEENDTTAPEEGKADNTQGDGPVVVVSGLKGGLAFNSNDACPEAKDDMCHIFRFDLKNSGGEFLPTDSSAWSYIIEGGGVFDPYTKSGPDELAPGGNGTFGVGAQPEDGTLVTHLRLTLPDGQYHVFPVPDYWAKCEGQSCELRTHDGFDQETGVTYTWTVEGSDIGSGKTIEYNAPSGDDSYLVKLSVDAEDRGTSSYRAGIYCSQYDDDCSIGGFR